jgi:hypothetical protein
MDRKRLKCHYYLNTLLVTCLLAGRFLLSAVTYNF